MRSSNPRIELELGFWINHRDDVRVSAGRRDEGRRRHRGHSRVEVAKLSSQYSLTESPVARAQHRSAIASELPRDSQARRHDVPGVERSQTANDRVGLAPLRIECVQILTDGATVVETYAEIECQSVPCGDRVARECGRRDGLPAIGR